MSLSLTIVPDSYDDVMNAVEWGMMHQRARVHCDFPCGNRKPDAKKSEEIGVNVKTE